MGSPPAVLFLEDTQAYLTGGRCSNNKACADQPVTQSPQEGPFSLLVGTCRGRQVWELRQQTWGQSCSRCGLGGRGSTGTPQRRRPSWKTLSTGPQRWDVGESSVPGKHREGAGGVSQEPDVLTTPRLPPEIETSRKATAGCHRQSLDGQMAVPEMARWCRRGGTQIPEPEHRLPAVCLQASYSASLCLSLATEQGCREGY